MFFDLILLLAILFLLFLLSMVWPPDSPWAPWWRTNKKTALAICKLANVKKSDLIFDLGCGDGELLIQAAKRGAKGIGIEIDPVRFFTAKYRVKTNRLEDKIKIKRGNFFNEDISKASIIVVYLVPKTLEKLIPKFKKELKKGTKIVSFKYSMSLPLLKEDKLNKLFLYAI